MTEPKSRQKKQKIPINFMQRTGTNRGQIQKNEVLRRVVARQNNFGCKWGKFLFSAKPHRVTSSGMTKGHNNSC